MSFQREISKLSNNHPITTKLIIIFLITYFLYLTVRYSFTRTIPTISNPTIFAEVFDPRGKSPVNLELKCKFYAINCEGNAYYVSPYFPYLGLKSKLIEDKLNHWKTLWRDPFWNIYWVGIQEAELGVNQLYFGPYKTF